MNLLPPRVIGPVSECSTKVRVQGQLPGATVELIDIGEGIIIHNEVASSADQLFTLTSALVAEHSIAAQQTLGADTSGPAAESVDVQKLARPVGSGVFVEPIFQCARCLWIDGLVPGATVEVTQGGTTSSSVEAPSGIARVFLNDSLNSGLVVAKQEACGESGEPLEAVPQRAPQGDRQREVLPAPIVESPLQECRTRLTLFRVIPGATVELERSMGPDGTTCFDRPSLWWGLNPALGLNETIRARQLFRECEKFSPWSTPPVVVGPLQPVPAPTVVGPLCAMGTTVRVCGLLADARVELHIVPGGHHGTTGGEVFEGMAPEDGCFDFALAAPGLPADSVICARQMLCGRMSALSNVVPVDDQPAVLLTPVVNAPLFSCSITVPLSNLQPGSRVYVIGVDIGVLGEAQVTSGEMDITVRPALQADWLISAYAIGCGHVSERADPILVEEAPDQLPPPEIVDPVQSCDRTVTVINTIPGAAVDLYVNDEWVGRSMASGDPADITVDLGPLEVGTEIWAQQQLCGIVSDPGPKTRVVEFDGEWEVLSSSDGTVIEDKSSILAVHAALLPTGKIVIFAGDQYTSDGQPIDNTVVMDAGPPWNVQPVGGIPDGVNLFCCGHSMLADGSVLTGGGTFSRPPGGWHGPNAMGEGGHWLGLRGSMRFKPGSGSDLGSWDQQGNMVTARPDDVLEAGAVENTGGRWYPSLVTLPDGRVLAIGGHPLNDDLRHTNTTLEIYDSDTGDWDYVGSTDYHNIPGRDEIGSRNLHSEYPSMHVLPEGSVFVASAMGDGSVWKWQPGPDPTNWCRVSNTPPGYGGNPQPYTSVLLPLRHDSGFSARVLLLGRQVAHTIFPEGICRDDTRDLGKSWSPTTGRTMPGQPNRLYPLSTLLPTGEIFVSGGTSVSSDDTAGLLQPEIYDPSTGNWRTVDASAERVRNYHSTALLLPDGSVWHSGSNRDCRSGLTTRDRTVELYRPWYFCWDRPHIGGVTSRVCHGQEFSIRTHDAASIEDVVIVRLSSFTHAFNPDQRLISLEFGRDEEEADLLRAAVPVAPGIAVVGYYLCFVINENRVPSIGQMIQICLSTRGSGSPDSPRDGRAIMDLIDRIRLELGPVQNPFTPTPQDRRLERMKELSKELEQLLREKP